jgi:hypothetical protein
MKKINVLSLVVLFVATLFIMSCNNDDDEPKSEPTTGKVILEFEHVFDGDAFTFGEKYTTSNGDEITPSKLLYYVTNISLSNDDGSVEHTIDESYFLVDASKPESMKLELADIPNGDYTKVNYLIGVDEARNTAGAQDGALDVVNGMFWSWNMGYIFMKMEGTYGANADQFSYHIGGFERDADNILEMSSSVPTGSTIVVNSSESEVHFMVDFAEFFKNPVDFDVAATPIVTMANAASVELSTNYKDMYMIHHVHNE